MIENATLLIKHSEYKNNSDMKHSRARLKYSNTQHNGSHSSQNGTRWDKMGQDGKGLN